MISADQQAILFWFHLLPPAKNSTMAYELSAMVCIQMTLGRNDAPMEINSIYHQSYQQHENIRESYTKVFVIARRRVQI